MIFNDESEIIQYIKKTAPNYTPEWVFDPENPDMGGAFALTFAHMMAQTGQLYDKVWDKQYASFLNLSGVEPVKEQAAEGIVVFTLSPGALEGSLVPAGTVLTDETGEVAFTMQQSIYVSPMQVESVFCTWGEKDIIYKAMEEETGQEIAMFDYQNRGNTQRHTLYIGHDTAFCIRQGGRIKMRFSAEERAEQEKLADPQIVRWEYYAEGWTAFEEVRWEDGGLCLSVSAQNPFETTGLSDGDIFFDGEDMLLHDEEADFTDINTFFIRCRCLSVLEASSIFIDYIDIEVTGRAITPQKIYHGDVEQEQSGFYPFGKYLMPFDSFYLACDEVFVKKGAEVEMSIEAGFHLCEADEQQEGRPIQWKAVMNKEDIAERKRPAAKIAEVSIEYWNGKDFVRLPLIGGQNGLFQTGDEASKKNLCFICPQDMEEATFNGLTSRWMRMRLIEISNFAGCTSCYAPYWKNILFHYQYRQSRLRPKAAFVENNMETMRLEQVSRLGQVFVPFSIQEPAVFIGFSSPPSQGPAGMLFVCAYPAEEKTGETGCKCFTASGWENIEVIDETDHMSHTGLFVLNIEARWQKETLFGKTCFWMMLYHRSESEERPAPVFIREIMVNAGKIACTGSGGNMAEHTVTKMPVSIGHINKVTNPFPIAGGQEKESVTQMRKRGSARLLHRQRAVTVSDFEALAFEAAGELLLCKCFENINGTAEKEAGAVTVVCQPEDYYLPGRNAGVTAQKVKRHIKEYCLPSLVLSGKLYVIEPVCVELCIQALLVVDASKGISRTEENIAGQITDFLNPVSGNFQGQGFGIGQIPDEKTMEYFLYMIEGVRFIQRLQIRGFILRKGEPSEIDLLSFSKKQFAAIKSGKHKVRCILQGEL